MEDSVVLGANKEYIQQTKKYNKNDAILAFALYILMLLVLLWIGKIFVQKNLNMTETYLFLITGIYSLTFIVLVFIICLMRKQKLVTVGFSMKQAKKSLIIGIISLAVTAGLFCIWFAITGPTIRTDYIIIVMRVIYYLIFIGFTEELVFRGYIGTRLYGYFANKQNSVAIVGIMFSLMHIPFHMTIAQISFIEYISTNWINLIILAITHCGFQWLYSKYNSIIAPTILHFLIDFVQWLIAYYGA